MMELWHTLFRGQSAACFVGNVNYSSMHRCTFEAAPKLTVRIYNVGLVGRQNVLCRGDVTLPADWGATGVQGLIVQLFEVADGTHAPDKVTGAGSKVWGTVSLGVHAVDEPGAQDTGLSFLQILFGMCTR